MIISKGGIGNFFMVKEELDGCVESTEIAMNVKIDAIWNGFVELKKVYS